MAPAEPLNVEVIYCPAPGRCDLVALSLPEGATVHDALHRRGLLERHALNLDEAAIGVWSRRVPLDTALRDRDRVEVYRPLTVDPKEARRLRYKGQGGKRRRAAVGTGDQGDAP